MIFFFYYYFKLIARIKPSKWEFIRPVEELEILTGRILHKYNIYLLWLIRKHERLQHFSLTTDVIIHEKTRVEEIERRESIGN